VFDTKMLDTAAERRSLTLILSK